MAPEIISRKDARAKGLKRYFTGRPCKHGHICEHYVVTSNCVECRVSRYWKDPELSRCQNRLQNKKSYMKNRIERLKKTKQWAKNNRDKSNGIKKRWMDNHKEYRAEYAKRNPNASRDQAARWRKENPEKAKDITSRWYRGHREFVLHRMRAHRARRSGAPGSHTPKDVVEIRVMQNNKCAYCRKPFGKALKPTLDHIVALVNGGTHDRTNLQLLCGICNSSKGAKDPINFARASGRLL